MYRGTSPLLHRAIVNNITAFAQHQLNQYYSRFLPNYYIKPPPIISIFHDKTATEPLFNHTTLVIVMPQDTKVHRLYTQAWKSATLALLQHPKNIQLIIDALIYNYVSHDLSNRNILSLDTPV